MPRVLLLVTLSLFSTQIIQAAGWYNIIIRNKTKDMLNKGDVNVHTTQAGCPSFWNGNDLQPGQEYSENQKAGICAGACFDYFTVKGAKYYIPNQCSSATIEIFDGFVNLNGNKAHPYDCYNVPAWGIELAAKKTAMETALLSLKAAEGFLDKIGKPVATTGASAIRQTATGTLTAGKEVALGVLSTSESTAEFLLTAIDIQKKHWDGDLKDFAKGNLGNVQLSGKIFNQDFNITFDLDLRSPYDAIKSAGQKIVDLFKTIASAMSTVSVGYQPLKISDDMIKLSLHTNILFK